ncbi:MAG: hypothetical protein NVS9B8_15930 [Candidatus Limnocylindrales bacterium]
MMVRRVFCDTGILVRYFADDDPPRALAAALLIDGGDTLVISTAVLIEVVHVCSESSTVGPIPKSPTR